MIDGGIYDGPCGKLHGSGREVLPGRPSDAGREDRPEARPEPSKDWRDYSWDVSKEMTNLRQSHRDDLSEVRRLRLGALDRAEAALQAMRAVLP